MLAVCTFGSWHEEAQVQIKKAAGALARHTGQLDSTAVSHIWRRLSVTLQKANSAVYRQDGGRPSQGGQKTVSLIQSLKFSNYRMLLVVRWFPFISEIQKCYMPCWMLLMTK